MKINSKHRVLSIILSVLMALSLMPVAVFADDGTTSNYVTLELTFGENVASEDVEAAKSIYQNVRYADCSKANEAYMSLYGITWEKGYLDVTDNTAPLRKYAGVSGSVTEVKYLVNGSVAGFTSLQSNGNNIDSTIGGNHQMFRTSYSVVGINDVNGNKAEITSGNIQAYVAGGYDSSFTESGKLTVDNIAFTSTTSTTMAASAAIATSGSSKKAVSAEMEIKNCTFSGRVYVYDNFENYGVMTYNIHDNVFDGTNYSGDSNAYAIFAQCKGGNNLIIKNNKISGFARGINIDHENINAVIEGNDITITDSGRSCIQLSSLASTSISNNNIKLTGGNAYTLHEKLLKMSKTPVILISGDKITGNGYLIYDDAVANNSTFTTENLSLTFDNVEIADTVNTTTGVKGGNKYENSPVVKEAVSGASSAIATIGGVGYASLAEAIAAAKDGDTVTLLADITEDVVINKNITFDLGGKTITNTGAGKATLTVASGATATVKNGSIVGGASYYNIQNNGTAILEGITATAGNTGSSMIDNWGTLTITSGTYTGGLNVVKSEEGSTLVINGGDFTLDYSVSNSYNAVIFVYGDTTINGGTFTQSLTTAGKWAHPQVVATGVVEGYTAITRVTGGKFTNKKSGEAIFRGVGKATSDNFEVSGGSFNKSISDGFCADGFIPTKNADGTYGVKEGKYVAKIGSTKYETFEDAVKKAASGKTITLLDDISLSSTVTVNKKVTIDLNQKTLTGTDKYILNIGANGNVTIMNGSINVSDSGSAITAYGTLALNDVDITGKATDYSLLYVNRNANVTIDKDTTITATDATSSAPYPTIFISGQDSDGNTYDPTLNIYGTVSAAKAPAIQGNGTDRGTSHINIYDGALIKSNKLAIYLPQICDVNITGGTVTGYCGIGIKSGTLNISGGTVQGVANDNVIGDQHSQTNGISYDGSAIMIDSYIGYAGNVTINISDNAKIESLHSTAIREIGNDNSQTNMVALNITGGEITGADGSDAVLVRETTAPTVAISGGTFSSAVKKEYCADGFVPVQNENGTYGVDLIKVAAIGTTQYTSLKDAVDAANASSSNVTIKLLENITLTESLSIGGSVQITLNLNKKTLTLNGAQLIIQGTGNVIINGGALQRTDVPESGIADDYAILVTNGSSLIVGSTSSGKLTLTGKNGIYDDGGKLNVRYTTIATDDTAIAVAGNTSDVIIGRSATTTITSKNGNCLNAQAGNAIVEKGTLTSNGTGEQSGAIYWASDGTLTINGGTITAASAVAVNQQSGTLKITGTTAKLVGSTALVVANSNATVTELSGGTYSTKPDVAWLAEGKEIHEVEGGYKVENPYVVEVLFEDGTVHKFDNWLSAFKSAEAQYNNATVRLLADITTKDLVSTFATVTIDFNGHTLTVTGHDVAAISVLGDASRGVAHVTLTDSVGNGGLVTTGVYGVNVKGTGATVTIDSGIYNCDTSVVQVESGAAYITGGTFRTGDVNKAYILNCIDTAYADGTAAIEVTGGTFEGFDPSADPEGTGTTYVKSGYKSLNDSNGNYTVKEANITVKVSSNISAAGTLTGGDMYAKGETVTVTATVNPGYVFLGWYDASGKLVNANTTYTFEAAESVDLIATFKGNKNVKLSVGLSGGIVTVGGDVTAKWRNDVKDNEFLLGTSFVLTAAPRAGYTFLYWINSEGRILSDEPEYKFTLGMDTSIKACFMETEQWEDSSYVIFRDNITKKIIWSGDVEMTAHSDGIYGTVAAPALLNYSGVTFKDWRDADGNVVTPDENGNIRITSNITIYAIYRATSDTFDVTVDGETVGSYGFRTSVSVTAPETKDGKYFAGWYRDGVLVSTNVTYSFIIRSATALTTEYTDTKQEPASVAILTVGDREQKADGDVVAPFSLDWSLAEGCELVKVGIIRTYDASLKDKLTLENVNGSTIKTKESVLTTSDGNYQFNLTMGSTAAANDVYMTGYVMYRAANGNIITLYTDVVTSPAGN